MTISSSLNAGVAGLNANATKLATISDNIANASTFGYRRTVADFNSLVLQGGGSSSYSAGGVRVSTMRLIDQRGSLVGSTNATDLAVDGRGMLPVTTEKDVNRGGATYPLSLMTTGSFRPDGQGYLKTESGMVLLGWMADTDGTIPNFPRVSNAGLQPVRINLNQFTANPTTEIAFAVNLPATATASTSSGDEESLALEYFNNVGISETLDVTFEPTVPTTGSSNTWTMTLRDSASGGSVVGSYTLVFNTAVGSGGTLSSVTTISGGAYNAATGTIPVTVAGGSIALSIGRPGAPDGMTQLSDSFAPVTITKNGSPVGNVTSVQVDSKGDVYAIYDQGFTRRIGQVPLVDVPNVNGLVALSNQTYQVSPESGPMFLWDAGDGPTGAVLGFAREGSATDVAEELTQLIVTQRAYSSNAKVIQTVDEMLQETQNIKR
ncbi:MAG: flagellar hook-basal body complex protein [Rhodobacter sp.]|nr:flagellar hook-basal body complex protein [Rhodobacter sp.]